MNTLKFQLLLHALLFIHQAANAQSEQVWAAVEATRDFGEDFALATTFSWRQSLPAGNWKRPVLQISGIYTRNAFLLMSSAACYYTVEQGKPDMLELRPWQAIAATFPDWKRIELVHLIRFEERFQKERKKWSFSPRVRYEISTRIALMKRSLDDRTLYLYCALEWLNNFRKPLQERFSNTRAFTIGLGFRFNGHSRLEALYEADVTDNVRENLIDIDVRILRLRWLIALD